jgi:aspartate/methionine/tyrosine aminotransferase
MELDYAAGDILITAGSSPLIYAVYKTIVDEGDKVFILHHLGITIIMHTLLQLMQ